MGIIEQIKNYAFHLFEKAFGWQKEKLEWDAAVKAEEPVPFHYRPLSELSEVSEFLDSIPTEKAKVETPVATKPAKPRKPKPTKAAETKKTSTATKVKAPVKTGKATARPTKKVVSATKPKTTKKK